MVLEETQEVFKEIKEQQVETQMEIHQQELEERKQRQRIAYLEEDIVEQQEPEEVLDIMEELNQEPIEEPEADQDIQEIVY